MDSIDFETLKAHPIEIADKAAHGPVRLSRPGKGDLVLLPFHAYDRLVRMEESVAKAVHVAAMPAA